MRDGQDQPLSQNRLSEQAEDGDPLQRPCCVSVLVIQSGNENREPRQEGQCQKNALPEKCLSLREEKLADPGNFDTL